MAHNLTVNTARSNLTTALVASDTQPYTPAPFPQLVYGGTDAVNLYLIDSAGYDARSGDATYTPAIEISLADETPQRGTFTISDGTDTTSALDWDATATEIETALNELNTDTGPYGDTVTVQKYANGAFYIKFDSAGAQSNLTINVTSIDPISSATVIAIVAGDVSNRNQQLVQIKADALITESSVATITNGWSLVLDANNVQTLAAVAAGEISANYRVTVTAPDTTVDVVATGPITLKP